MFFYENENRKEPERSEFWDVSEVDISKIDTSRKLISFTFDDAPSGYLENIAAIFAGYNEENPDCPASATVFFNGYRLQEYSPTLIDLASTAGFELGNHTHGHLDLTTLTEEELKREIDEVDKALKKHDGKERHLLRAPYGEINETVKKISYTPIIDWTIDTLDWTGVSADEIYDTVFTQKFSGAIVLMHDGPQNTLKALKRLLPDLKEAGYQVVSVSQLSKANDCPLKTGSVYIRARKKEERTGQG
ncbi:MAG: polysaccharide deacetylase family protein [Clostridia bacterium]|nr:polysaccharide deacetylase family protein [Clostridia bacterium]